MDPVSKFNLDDNTFLLDNNQVAKVSPQDVEALMIGLGLGLEQKDFSADMSKCATGEFPLMTDVSEIIQALELKTLQGLEDAVTALIKAFSDYKAFMQTCSD